MISGHTEGSDNVYLCGECFAVVEDDDKYCWDCGAEMGDRTAYSREDLSKREKKE